MEPRWYFARMAAARDEAKHHPTMQDGIVAGTLGPDTISGTRSAFQAVRVFFLVQTARWQALLTGG